MINNISELNNKIIKCRSCNRLINFRKKIIKNKRKQYKNQKYWGKPITGFGDITGKILFVEIRGKFVSATVENLPFVKPS